ncbi:DUF4288 domain-containing protein [Pelobium sp.]|nr:DUF4288 domain-containing protein [Pelobium sp.]MDA9555196.1 DUF4288 domain-containing protein [Pelobium sp.]
MNWYVAKIIFQIEDKEMNYPQFDEQLRLIDAINNDLALEMAYQLGLMQQDEIKSSKEHTLKWKFIAVTELYHLGEIEHGKEIHYQISEPEHAITYLEMIKEKAAGLKNRKITY